MFVEVLMLIQKLLFIHIYLFRFYNARYLTLFSFASRNHLIVFPFLFSIFVSIDSLILPEVFLLILLCIFNMTYICVVIVTCVKGSINPRKISSLFLLMCNSYERREGKTFFMPIKQN